MHQHGGHRTRVSVEPGHGARRIILVGNPNVGKSVIFSHLTGIYMEVSNYPGTTVEVASGPSRFHGGSQVVDTPGVNSLVPRSEDERVARDILLEDGERVVVQVADAKNLRRALLISLQLAEMGLPFVLDLNMADEAQAKGIALDLSRLSQILGVPVVETVAVRGQGLSDLDRSLQEARPSGFKVRYSPEIEAAITRIGQLLPVLPISPRSTALFLIAGDHSFEAWLSPKLTPEQRESIKQAVAGVDSSSSEPLNYAISRRKAEVVDGLLAEVTSVGRGGVAASWIERLGQWTMHPLAGFLVLLLVLLLMYLVVGRMGAGIAVDFVQSVIFNQFINPWAILLFSFIPIAFGQELFVGKFGIITMSLTYAIAIVLPIMLFFFVGFGFLEDVGYLPRLAVMANKVFKVIGLSGKAALPMVLGLG